DVLKNGNVVVSYVRSASEKGLGTDQPVMTILNPSVAPGSAGFVIARNIEIEQTDVPSQLEGPPVVTALADGRFLAVWNRDALSDNVTSMKVEARFFNHDGSAASNEFQIGTWAVDGSDGFDLPNLTVKQLTGGNIVVGYVRNLAEAGGNEPVYTVISNTGSVVRANVEMPQTDFTGLEGPPAITTLADGRFMAVWAKNALSDDASMAIKGRIFNADGTAATNEFRVGSLSVDGADGYDSDNLVIEQLSDGKVVVGYVEQGAVAGTEYPLFSVIDPSQTPGSAGFAVASDVQINTSASSPLIGPPVIESIGNGQFVAAWVDGVATSNEVKFRIFDSSGKPLSNEITVSQADGAGASNLSGFDWNNLSVVTHPEGTFTISWVGANDGSGTGVQSSGALNPQDYYGVDTNPIRVNTDTSSDQSPPKTVVLADGRVLQVWENCGLSDDTTTMQLQGRIMNADGTPATSQFALGSWAVDGFDGYNTDNLDVDVLKNGNVVVSYVRNTAEQSGLSDQPVMTILNPAAAPGSPGFIVARNLLIEQTDVAGQAEGPPTVVALADGGFVAVWARDAVSDNSLTMKVQGRFFNADGTPSSNEFQVGSWAVDGSDEYDLSNLTVKQLAGGNIVVGYVRNASESGSDEPVFTVLSKTGAVVRADVEMQQNDTTAYESPPAITTLADGRFMAVWEKNGLSTDSSLFIQGRIFNADGTASTNEFTVGVRPASGSDFYDTPSLNITTLSDGRVVVGFVENIAVDGQELPYFSIIDPSKTPGSAGFAVVADRQVNTDITSSLMGPPVISALANGTFVAAWADGATDGAAVKFRIFASDGQPLSGEVTVAPAGANGMSSNNGFDWDNLNIVTAAD
ncbi:MAG: hypothetical protein EBU97_02295, partial [Rhodobacteraceae bacterium]|nr:hypothetical protein [Paracoccaceae bacterium]